MSTSLFLGELSALEFWRSTDDRSQAKPSKARPQPGTIPSPADLEALVPFQHMFGRGDMVLILAESPSRWNIEGARCRAWNGCTLPNSFAKITKGLYVSTPEATFVQLASKLPFHELVRIGMELCGTYSLCAERQDGFVARKALTSKEALGRYLLKANNVTGVKQARRALKYITNRSASPAETNLTILLCLPTSLGGFGLPLPQLNKQIEVGKGNRSITHKRFFKCDLLWSEIRTVVEYDSDTWHDDPKQRANDASRRNALESMGYTVITATKRQLYNAVETERLATIIARKLNRYHKSARPNALAKRHKLRKSLLSNQ